MMTIKAVVRGGRLLVNEATTLPEGTELELTLVDPPAPSVEAEAADRTSEDLEVTWAEQHLNQIVLKDRLIRELGEK
jgi:hypothetical protein